MDRATDDFVPFLLVGLTAWRWFQGTINNGGNSVLISRSLIRQVFIPKAVFPLVVILTDLFKFAVVLVILLIFLWLYGFGVNIAYLAFPFVIFVQLILITGFTFLLAGVVPFFPDFKILANHILQLLFYVSGIFFSSEIIPDKYLFYFYFNPMANIIEAYREILMYGHFPDAVSLLKIGLFSVIVLIIASMLLSYNEHRYPKLNTG